MIRVSSSHTPWSVHSPELVVTGGSSHRMTVIFGRSWPGSAVATGKEATDPSNNKRAATKARFIVDPLLEPSWRLDEKLRPEVPRGYADQVGRSKESRSCS